MRSNKLPISNPLDTTVKKVTALGGAAALALGMSFGVPAAFANTSEEVDADDSDVAVVEVDENADVDPVVEEPVSENPVDEPVNEEADNESDEGAEGGE